MQQRLPRNVLNWGVGLWVLSAAVAWGAPWETRTDLIRVGRHELQQGNPSRAATFFERVKDHSEANKQFDRLYAFSLHGLATAYQSRFDLQPVEPLYQDALKVKLKYLNTHPADYVATEYSLGQFYQQQGRLLSARARIEAALKRYSALSGKDAALVAQMKYSLGSIALALGESKQADQYFTEAIKELAGNTEADDLLWAIGLGQAQLKRDRGDLAGAQSDYQQLLSQAEIRLNANGLNEEQRLRLRCDLAQVRIEQGLLQLDLGHINSAVQQTETAIKQDLAIVAWNYPSHPTLVQAQHVLQILKAVQFSQLSAQEIQQMQAEITAFTKVRDDHTRQADEHQKQVVAHQAQVKEHEDLANKLRQAGQGKEAQEREFSGQVHRHMVEHYKHNVEFHKYMAASQQHQISSREARIANDLKKSAQQTILAEAHRLRALAHQQFASRHTILSKSVRGATDIQKHEAARYDHQGQAFWHQAEVQFLKSKNPPATTYRSPTKAMELEQHLALLLSTAPTAESDMQVRDDIAEAVKTIHKSAENAQQQRLFPAADRAWARVELLTTKAFGMNSKQLRQVYHARSQHLAKRPGVLAQTDTAEYHRHKIYNTLASRIK